MFCSAARSGIMSLVPISSIVFRARADTCTLEHDTGCDTEQDMQYSFYTPAPIHVQSLFT